MRFRTAPVSAVIFFAFLTSPAALAQPVVAGPQRGGETRAVISDRAPTMTAGQTREAESRLTQDPHDLATRELLMSYYYTHLQNDDRLRHVFWMVENHPEARMLSGGAADIVPDTVLGTKSDYDRGKSLWLAAVAKHPSDAPVRLNAARYFVPTDLALAVDSLEAVEETAPRDVADLYGRILNAATEPLANPMMKLYLPDRALLDRVRTHLAASQNALLLADLAAQVRDRELAESYRSRAVQMDTDVLNKLTASDAANRIPTGAIRVGGGVQAQKLMRQVQPEYPPLAKQTRIQGTVRFNALIGTDGRVRTLQLVSGHPLLVEAARDAVSQWVYQPTLLNGHAIDVATTIDVNFTMSRAVLQPAAGGR